MMNHSQDNGYNRGVSPFGDFNFPRQDNAASHFNVCPPPTNNNQQASNSPWEGQQQKSGYSSVSPPGTRSSCSSLNSNNFGSPPRDLNTSMSVDSLLTSLLQVVSSKSFGSNCDVRNLTGDGFGMVRCAPDCNDPLCDNCLGMRQNRPSSSSFLDHCFGSFPRGSFEMTTTPPPCSMQGTSASSLSPRYIPQRSACEIHRESKPLWCQTCNRAFCNECSINVHRGHVTVFLMDAIESAEAQTNQVLSDAHLGLNLLTEDLETVQLSAETLDEKAHESTSEVMQSVRRVFIALEAREKELLARIEKIRLAKFASLKVRDEGLRNGISRLCKIIDKLTIALETCAVTGNPLDLLLVKDMASAEVFQVRQNRLNLPPPEENWISFAGPESNVLHAIANMGSLTENNPGPIGDRRTRGHSQSQGPSPQNPMPTIKPLTHAHFSVPRGRPIALNNYPVIWRPARNTNPPTPKTVKIIGSNGEGDDNLCRPWGVACDKDGHIIVADRSNNRIQIYREDGGFVRQFGTHGSAPGQFDRPAGITVDSRRRIIVADKDNHRIQILTMEGGFLLTFGEKGSRCGQFHYPWDVAVNNECQIVVSDTRNHRVQLFSAEGVFLRKYGYESTPSMWKHFDSPRGVAFNPEGNVVTTDFNNHRVIVIESDFLSAKVLGCDANSGMKQFLRPQGVIVDDEGNLVIADSRNHRIQVFDSSGKLIWKFGTYGKAPHEMDRPSGIALTRSGKIAVVDFGNNRVLLI